MLNKNRPVDKKNKLEEWLKILSFLLTAITFFWGVYQYKIENERNFRKYVFEQRANIYDKYLIVCSELATSEKDSILTKHFNDKYKEFEKLHFGQMTLVQDTMVFKAATEFYVAINRFKQTNSQTTNSDLQIIIEGLSKYCRSSLKETWTESFNKIFTQ